MPETSSNFNFVPWKGERKVKKLYKDLWYVQRFSGKVVKRRINTAQKENPLFVYNLYVILTTYDGNIMHCISDALRIS